MSRIFFDFEYCIIIARVRFLLVAAVHCIVGSRDDGDLDISAVKTVEMPPPPMHAIDPYNFYGCLPDDVVYVCTMHSIGGDLWRIRIKDTLRYCTYIASYLSFFSIRSRNTFSQCTIEFEILAQDNQKINTKNLQLCNQLMTNDTHIFSNKTIVYQHVEIIHNH